MLTIYITHLSDDENGMVENDKRINVLNLNKLNSKPKKKKLKQTHVTKQNF